MSDQFKGLSFAFFATLGGGLFAIPYRLSLETVAPLTVVWGVFLWALYVFSTGSLACTSSNKIFLENWGNYFADLPGRTTRQLFNLPGLEWSFFPDYADFTATQ